MPSNTSRRGRADPVSGPLPNSYWLPGRQVCAGEYPGHWVPATARVKLGVLLDAGIRSFVDLTEPRDGLSPYEAQLHEAATERSADVRYVRLGVRDMDIPAIPHMSRILDHIAVEVAAGRTVYLHCWGGVGRTGTVVGCYLAHGRRSGDEALALLAELWQAMSAEKLNDFPESPQTPAQRDFVRNWTSPPSP